jgi:hypothetical protein
VVSIVVGLVSSPYIYRLWPGDGRTWPRLTKGKPQLLQKLYIVRLLYLTKGTIEC